MTILIKRVKDPWLALGLAAHFLSKRKPFGAFPARDLLRTIDGQVRRGHYLFALDSTSETARVVGYIGWALYSHETAERFAATGQPPAEDTGGEGEVIWVLTAAAERPGVLAAFQRAMRADYPTHRAMAIRHKANGKRAVLDQWRQRAPRKENRGNCE